MRLPITRERIRTHFHYAWWQYVLLVCLAIFGWNLLYTTTRYRSPESLKVEWYCQGVVAPQAQDKLDALMEQLRLELFPDMEEVTFTSVAYDQTYGDMQLMVWSSASQGDLYLLQREPFQNLASGGAMAQLTPYIESGALTTGDGRLCDRPRNRQEIPHGRAHRQPDGAGGLRHQPGGLRDGPAGQRRKPGQHPQADAVAD